MTRRSVRWTAIIGTDTADGMGCGVGAVNEDKDKKESLRDMPRLEIAHEESGISTDRTTQVKLWQKWRLYALPVYARQNMWRRFCLV